MAPIIIVAPEGKGLLHEFERDAVFFCPFFVGEIERKAGIGEFAVEEFEFCAGDSDLNCTQSWMTIMSMISSQYLERMYCSVRHV